MLFRSGRLAPHPLPIPLGLLAWETPAPTTLLCVVAPSPPLPRHVTNPGRGPPTGSSQLGEGASPGSHRQPPGSRPTGPRESCAPTPGRSGEPARCEARDSRDASPANDLYVLSSQWSSSFQPVSPPSWQAFSSAESCCPGFLRRFKPFLQLGIYLFLNSSV